FQAEDGIRDDLVTGVQTCALPISTEVFDPSKIVMVADHFMPAKDTKSAELQKRLKEWADAHGVTFYGQGRGGIEHTLLCQEGWRSEERRVGKGGRIGGRGGPEIKR